MKYRCETKELVIGYGGAPLASGITLGAVPGQILALIGPNGAGKSTLLKTLAGQLAPLGGAVLLDGRSLTDYTGPARARKLALMLPHTRRTELTSCFEFAAAGRIPYTGRLGILSDTDRQAVRDALELVGASPLAGRDFNCISDGQRQRVLLARAICQQPGVLLLDEPTNYLDVQHIEWLKRYLNDYENAFVLISHDIPFLNSVINVVYHMENQEFSRYVGNYDDFMKVYEVKKAQLEAAYNRQQKEIADLKDFVARNKARVSTRNMAMSRQKKLDKMDVIELAAERPKPEFNFKVARTPGRYIFTTKELVIGYDEPLSIPLNITMERGQKIALIGSNGIGKTTLLKSLLGLIPPVSGTVEQGDFLNIGYFEQEMDKNIQTTCIEEIWKEFPTYTQYEVRSALAKCGLTTKHIESLVRVLSGGEQAKVRLCKLINRESNVLLLDEPTNHLDQDAKDELRRALTEYKGSILMVCHEPDFYQGWTTDVWDCTKWTTKLV